MTTAMSRLLRHLLCYGILAALTASIGWAQAPEKRTDRAPVAELAPQAVSEDRSARTPQTNQVQAAEAPEHGRTASTNVKTVVAAESSTPSVSNAVEDIAAARVSGIERRQSRGETVDRQATEVAVNGQMANAGVQNRSAVLVSILILFGCAVVGVIAWLASTLHSREIKAALRADFHTRQALLDALCQTKKKRTRTESALVSIYKETKDTSVRTAAIEALCAVTDSKASGQDVLRYLDMAFRDADSSVRRVAYNLALRSADAKIIERLTAQLSVEPDTDLREMILNGFLTRKEQSVCAAMAELRLDEAEAGVRELVAYGFEQETAANLFNRIAVLREQSAKSAAAEASNTRVRRSQDLAQQAAQRVAAGETNIGEDLIRQSLAEDPGNEVARRLLSDLPELRNLLAAASKARFQSDLLRCLQERHVELLRRIQNRRSDVERLFAERDLDAVMDGLLDMAVLDPSDKWVREMLAQMPKLQEDLRRAVLEREMNEHAARIRDHKAQLEDAWQRRDLDRAEEVAVSLQAILPTDEQTSAFLCRIAEAKRRKASEEAWADIDAALKEGNLDRAESALQSLACCDDFDKTRVNAVLGGLVRLRSELHASEQLKTQLERNAKTEELRKRAAGILAKDSADEAEPIARQLVALVPGDQQAAALLARIREHKVRQKAQALRESAVSLQEKGDLDAALTKIDESLAALPGDSDLSALRENILSVQRRKRYEAMRNQVQSHLKACDFDQAEATLRALLPIADDPSVVLKMLDDIPDLRRKQMASASLADEARSQDISLKAMKDAQKLFEQGNFAEAATKLRKAIAADPSNDRAAKLLQRVFQFDSTTASGSRQTRLDSYGQIVDDSSS